MQKTNEEKIIKMLDKLESMFNDTKQDLETFVMSYSKYIDQFIIDNQLKQNLIYISGKATLKAFNSNFLKFHFECYFKDLNERYIHKNLESNLINIDDYLTSEAKLFLINKKEIIFDVEPPKTNK